MRLDLECFIPAICAKILEEIYLLLEQRRPKSDSGFSNNIAALANCPRIIVFALFLHCFCIVFALFLHCFCIVFALFLHCFCIVFALFLHCFCIVFALFLLIEGISVYEK